MFASKDLFFTRPSGYQISRSVRIRSSASAYFNRTFSSGSSNQIRTLSAWVKRGSLGGTLTIIGCYDGTSTASAQLYFNSSDQLVFDSGGSASTLLTTTQVFRDPSAWYHIVFVVDTTQATASNRQKLYVNGVQVTSFSAANYPGLGAASQLITASANNKIGTWWNSTAFFDGYLTEINFIDGLALTPSSFGQTNTVTGVWQPIKYTGAYGINGFYLNFSDNSAATAAAIGKDYSGNGNNWTPNNISVTAGVTYDSMIDVPTLFADGGNGRGNYAVLNVVSNLSTGSTLSSANLDVVTASTGDTSIPATIYVTSGKWYCEATINSVAAGVSGVGIIPSSQATGTGPGSSATSYGYTSTGFKRNNTTNTAYGATYTTNDVIGIALDLNAGTLTFYKNNTSQGQAYSGISGEYTFAFGEYGATSSAGYSVNFGQRPFTYTPPTGFVALNTQNLPTPTISNGATVMAASTYTGTGATQSIVNSGNNTGAISFKPDWVWIKSRSAATNNNLFDSVRGTTNYLISNSTAAEATNANTLTAFGTNGFTLGSDAGSVGVNVNAATYVAWQWQAGQGSTSSNTSGSITSTVSVNATAGFSIVTYTGTGANATVGHGLGVTPAMVIVKQRNSARSWLCKHQALSGNNVLFLEQTTAATTNANGYVSLTSSTVFSITNGGTTIDTVGASGGTYVAYCFSAVAGYSAFGSYTGNGSTDGPFVYCGFIPRFIMVKRTDAAFGWFIWDTARSPSNQVQVYLQANATTAEQTFGSLDVLANGFKIRGAPNDFNASGSTQIFMAFAENPFKNSLAR